MGEYAQSEEFVTWRTDTRTIYRQGSNSPQSEIVGALREGDLSYREEKLALPNTGSDLFANWAWSADSPDMRIRLFSQSDNLRQRAQGISPPRPVLDMLGLDGYWTDVQVSHGAHYIAGPWAANNQTMGAGQRLLGIINTQEPQETRAHIKNPPGGADEQVDKIQWISDNDMIVRNRSGRKFLWDVGANTYNELPALPASFNGYTLTAEFYAPDGLRYGGLMSKDGGATTEVWTSKPDYSDMQQVTQAGMKLIDFQWLGSSKYVSAWASELPITNDGNTCKTVIVDASSARQLSASQIESARIPTYLPCGFRATK